MNTDRYQSFSSWLRRKEFNSAPQTYTKYMLNIEKLLLRELTTLQKPALKAYYHSLQTAKGFQAMTANNQNNHNTAFQAYIEFVETNGSTVAANQ